jgi:RNA polymerase sigma factor (sigma-70 family)
MSMSMDTKERNWGDAMRAEREGEAKSYEFFLKDFAASLRRLIGIRLRQMQFSAAEAEDIVQEVLIAVHTRRDQWDSNRPLLPWLNAITRYKLIDACRRLRRDAAIRIELSDGDWASLSDFHALASHRNLTDAEKMISALPVGEQAAVRAIGLNGASAAEAAAQLGSSEGAVRVAFHRALKRLTSAAKDRN